MKTIKQLRAESTLQKVITNIIHRAFGAVASVSFVDITKDMKDAKVCLAQMTDQVDKDALQATIKSKIGKQVSFRCTPRLKFTFVDFCA